MVSDARSYQTPQGSFVFFRPKPDGDIDPAGEAGWFLQRERERRGESLEEAGWATGVHPHHLQAIEAGDLTGLPSRTEALEMIGAYAGHLGFDPEPLKQHYAQFLPRIAAPAKAVARKLPRPLGSAKIIVMPYLKMAREHMTGAGGIVAAVAGAVLLIGVAAWVMSPSADNRMAAAAPPASQQGVTSVASISSAPEAPAEDTRSISAADSAMAQVDSLAALIERETQGEITSATGQAPGVASVATAAAPNAPQAAAPIAGGQGLRRRERGRARGAHRR